MNFFDTQAPKTYCDSCRENLLSPTEVWKIKFEFPGTGGLNLLKKNQEYLLCKKCFLDNAEALELNIIKRQKTEKKK